MNQIRATGEMCRNEDENIAYDLYANGVLPESEESPESICVEADGTYVALRTGEKVEVKAAVGYCGKTQGTRKQRNSAIHFGCVGTIDEFWTQAVGKIGTRFDLGSIKNIYCGFDGEKKYQKLENYLPKNTKIEGQLDPFHLCRKVSNCFKEPCKECRKVINHLYAGQWKKAVILLTYSQKMHLTKENLVDETIAYIENNAEFIRKDPISLGSIESDQQHIFKARFSGVPRVWSREGVDSIARIRARIFSNQEICYKNRNSSYSIKYTRLRQKKIEKSFGKVPYVYELTTGKGYNYPVQAHLNPQLKIGYERACINFLKGKMEL